MFNGLPGSTVQTVFGLVYMGIRSCCSWDISVSRSIPSRVGSNRVNRDCASSSPTSLELKFPWVLKCLKSRESRMNINMLFHFDRLLTVVDITGRAMRKIGSRQSKPPVLFPTKPNFSSCNPFLNEVWCRKLSLTLINFGVRRADYYISWTYRQLWTEHSR